MSSTPGLVRGGRSARLEPTSSKEAFEGLELGEGKLSRPVLRGPGGRKAAGLLGTNWILIGVSVLFYGTFAWLGSKHARHISHLSFARRMGVPELSCADGRQTLVREGIYRVVRHPVYLTAAVAGMAFALVVNYLGVYILFVSAFPLLYLITVLEEHELIDRFGEAYRRYQREVPRLNPRWQKTS
ncbi:MAG TPA: isoprenylcysteine carboxylmethyltransferase family protein [Verrucomicrobiae bacterium]|nr:isoprenylcysteine carboxylmethyltransferase family protein [Verrucomicrobiae bacterium]